MPVFAMILAHPHGAAARLSIPWALVLIVALGVIVLVAARIPVTHMKGGRNGEQAPLAAEELSPRGLWWTARALGAAGFLFAIVAGRAWNSALTPILIVVVGWPLLLVLSAALGQVWRWIDPFDTLARLTGGLGGPRGTRRKATETDVGRAIDVQAWEEQDVRLAALPALAWVAYLAAYENPFDPQVLARILATYTAALVIGCLLAGRHSWLQRAEVFGATFRWVGRIRKGGLVTWDPPRGSALVCGVLIGGLLFEGFHTLLLTEHPPTALGQWLLAAGVLFTAALAGLLLIRLDIRAGRLGAPGSVTAASVPMVAAVGLSIALAENRLFIGLQLLPRVIADPFARGDEGSPIVVDPLGYTALVILRLVVLLVGAVLAVRIARRRSPGGFATLPAVITVEILLAIAVLGLAKA